jgi:AsmA protein
MKFVKKLVLSIVVLVVLLAAGLFAAVKLAPVDRIEKEVVAQVKAKTGRDLAFSDAQLMFWPYIGVRLHDVTFSNPSWAADKSMATLGLLDIRLAVMPLLQKRVELQRLVLQKPEIFLEVSPDGKRSWDMDLGARADDAPAQKTASSSGTGDIALKFGDFDINDGRLSYNDRQKNTKTVVEDMDITASMPDIESPLHLDGAFTYLARRVQVVLDLDAPMALADGKASAGNLVVRTDGVNAGVKGNFATSGTMLNNGEISADISSLSGVAAWASGAAGTKLPFEKLSFKSKATASAETLKLDGASLSLDDVSAAGDVSLGLGGARPSLYARLKIGKINLDRFVTGAADAPAAKPASAAQGGDWDATPIDFSGLKAIDADVVLQTEGFSVKGVDVGPSTLTALLKNGVLTASSSDATLFGGRFSSTLGLNAAAAVPTQTFSFDMKGVQAQPVLKNFADFDKLTGTVDADISVTSAGNSQKAIVSALDGKGSTVFRNGAITGLDLVNIAQAVQKGLTSFNIGGGKTEFVDLGGTFTITKGVLANNDLKLRGPLLQATGSGTADFPRKTLKYRVIPTLTASSATENAKGLSVPVDITGPFASPRIKPDLAAAVTNVLQNKDALKATAKDIKEQGKAIEGNLKDLKKEMKTDPGAALQNLLGGGLTKPKAEPAPAPAPAPEASPAMPFVAPEAQPQPEAPAAQP